MPDDSKSYKQILKTSSIVWCSSAINLLVGAMRMKAAAIFLGPSGVGLIGIIQNLMATAATVIALGISNAGTQKIAAINGRDEQQLYDLRSALFSLTVILSFIGGLGFWSIRHLLASQILMSPELAPEIGWIAIGVAITVACGSQYAILNGMRRIGDIAFINIFTALVAGSIGVIGLMFLGRSGLLLFILAPPLTNFLISQTFLARIPSKRSFESNSIKLIYTCRQLVRSGYTFMIASLVVVLGQLLVRSMIQLELGPEYLGYFQAAWAISITYIGFVLSAMAVDYYPRLTAIILDRESANRLVNQQTQIAILLAGPLLLFMQVLAPWLIETLFSSTFLPGVTLMRWQLLGDVLKLASWPLGFILLAHGKNGIFMFKEVVVTSFFVASVHSLLPFIELTSTGIGYFLMYALNLGVLLWLGRKVSGFVWCTGVVQDLALLFTLVCVTGLLVSWGGDVGGIVGLIIALILALRSILRLSELTDQGLLLGKTQVFIDKIAKLLNSLRRNS